MPTLVRTLAKNPDARLDEIIDRSKELAEANEARRRLRMGELKGAAVLTPGD